MQVVYGSQEVAKQTLALLDSQSPLVTLQRLPKHSYPILVNSNTFHHGKVIANTKILAWNPLEVVYVKENRIYHNSTVVEHKLWELLETILHERKTQWKQVFSQHEILQYIGLYGYMGYELGRMVYPHKHKSSVAKTPDAYFILPSDYIIYGKETIYLLHLDGRKHLPPRFPAGHTIVSDQATVFTATSIEEYLQQMDRILEYIYAGEIYQINYTQQFAAHTHKEPRQIFSELQQQHSTTHAAYIEHRDFQILSLSPELYMQVQQGNVLTKPIKGTRKRGSTKEEDRKLAEELQTSEKDNAELAMIVDLLRNDLGKSSLPESVQVEKHAALESYSNVHHLVSTINSKIEPKNVVKLLLRAFPGGSISGVPKLRALEIIEEVETIPRGIYTGTIGYFSLTDSAEFNIAIRTILLQQNIAYFHAGGGIVADSKSLKEYIECLHKAKHIANYFGKTFTGNISWLNGKFVATEQANTHRGIVDGFFETILIENGKLQRFTLHEKRLHKGLKYYGLNNSVLPSREDIEKLLLVNLAETARLKITVVVARNPIACMQVFPYNKTKHPITLLLMEEDQINDKLLNVINAGVKPLNYELYATLTKTAVEFGHWDTVGVRNNIVTEGGRSNIYVLLQGKWYTPKQNVVQGTIRSILLARQKVKLKNISLTELLNADAICVSNALIGIQQVTQLSRANQAIWETSKNEVLVNKDINL